MRKPHRRHSVDNFTGEVSNTPADLQQEKKESDHDDGFAVDLSSSTRQSTMKKKDILPVSNKSGKPGQGSTTLYMSNKGIEELFNQHKIPFQHKGCLTYKHLQVWFHTRFSKAFFITKDKLSSVRLKGADITTMYGNLKRRNAAFKIFSFISTHYVKGYNIGVTVEKVVKDFFLYFTPPPESSIAKGRKYSKVDREKYTLKSRDFIPILSNRSEVSRNNSPKIFNIAIGTLPFDLPVDLKRNVRDIGCITHTCGNCTSCLKRFITSEKNRLNQINVDANKHKKMNSQERHIAEKLFKMGYFVSRKDSFQSLATSLLNGDTCREHMDYVTNQTLLIPSKDLIPIELPLIDLDPLSVKKYIDPEVKACPPVKHPDVVLPSQPVLLPQPGPEIHFIMSRARLRVCLYQIRTSKPRHVLRMRSVIEQIHYLVPFIYPVDFHANASFEITHFDENLDAYNNWAWESDDLDTHHVVPSTICGSQGSWGDKDDTFKGSKHCDTYIKPCKKTHPFECPLKSYHFKKKGDAKNMNPGERRLVNKKQKEDRQLKIKQLTPCKFAYCSSYTCNDEVHHLSTSQQLYCIECLDADANFMSESQLFERGHEEMAMQEQLAYDTAWELEQDKLDFIETEEPFPVSIPTKSDLPCKFFLKGICKKGDSCNFSHSSDPELPSPVENKLNGASSSTVPTIEKTRTSVDKMLLSIEIDKLDNYRAKKNVDTNVSKGAKVTSKSDRSQVSTTSTSTKEENKQSKDNKVLPSIVVSVSDTITNAEELEIESDSVVLPLHTSLLPFDSTIINAEELEMKSDSVILLLKKPSFSSDSIITDTEELEIESHSVTLPFEEPLFPSDSTIIDAQQSLIASSNKSENLLDVVTTKDTTPFVVSRDNWEIPKHNLVHVPVDYTPSTYRCYNAKRFSYHDNAGAGNCAYHAVSDVILRLTNVFYHHHEIRKRVHDSLLPLSETFMNRYDYTEQEWFLILHDTITLGCETSDCIFEFIALVMRLHVSLYHINSNKGPVEVTEIFDENDQSDLLRVNIGYIAKGHFVALFEAPFDIPENLKQYDLGDQKSIHSETVDSDLQSEVIQEHPTELIQSKTVDTDLQTKVIQQRPIDIELSSNLEDALSNPPHRTKPIPTLVIPTLPVPSNLFPLPNQLLKAPDPFIEIATTLSIGAAAALVSPLTLPHLPIFNPNLSNLTPPTENETKHTDEDKLNFLPNEEKKYVTIGENSSDTAESTSIKEYLKTIFNSVWYDTSEVKVNLTPVHHFKTLEQRVHKKSFIANLSLLVTKNPFMPSPFFNPMERPFTRSHTTKECEIDTTIGLWTKTTDVIIYTELAEQIFKDCPYFMSTASDSSNSVFKHLPGKLGEQTCKIIKAYPGYSRFCNRRIVENTIIYVAQNLHLSHQDKHRGTALKSVTAGVLGFQTIV